MKEKTILDGLITGIPALTACHGDIERAFAMLCEIFSGGGKLLLCGNGGSAADCEHIAGELMKGFLKKRPLSAEMRGAFCALGGEGARLAERLQGALPAISLTGAPALSTAFANDVDPELVFAQQAHALGRPGDALLGLSTSGRSASVRAALLTARARGMRTIGMTGRSGEAMRELCDVCICVPETETYRVQELHLPVYHALCAMLEDFFFEA